MIITNRRIIKALLPVLQESEIIKEGLKDLNLNKVTKIITAFGPFIRVFTGNESILINNQDLRLELDVEFRTNKIVIIAWTSDDCLGTVRVKYHES